MVKICLTSLKGISLFIVATAVNFAPAQTASAQTTAAQDKLVRLNQVQVIGSHNSYNLGFAPSEEKFARGRNAKTYESLEYHHASLTAQLNGGVRQHEMEKPGFKVIHIPDLNQRSSCLLFTDCLREIRTWSKAHPEHVPLFLLIENK